MFKAAVTKIISKRLESKKNQKIKPKKKLKKY